MNRDHDTDEPHDDTQRDPLRPLAEAELEALTDAQVATLLGARAFASVQPSRTGWRQGAEA